MIAARAQNALRIAALDEEALAAGLRPGQGLAEARAMRPDIAVIEDDPVADRRFLEGLADWCTRYTPLVALDGGDGLFLDITGCAHLFGGEKAMLDDLLNRLFQLGLKATGAIASAPGLSYAVARFGGGGVVLPEQAGERLAPLPVAALRLPDATVTLVLKAGLKQVGDLLELPRAPLARRFGPHLVARLDQATGQDEEAISPRLPVAELSAERRLAEPVTGEDDLLAIAGQLAARLKPGLEARGLGGRLFELTLFRVDGHVFHIRAGAAAPLRDERRITSLFAGRFAALHDDLDAGYGFDILRLSVRASQPASARQLDLGGEGAETSARRADFIGETLARFGPDVLVSPILRESHVPERGSGFLPVAEAEDNPLPPVPHPCRAFRPIRLFRAPELVEAVAEVPEGPPVHFRWRRSFHRVRRAEGPERLAAEWWIDGEGAPTRDYYRIEDEDGRRYWLYREGLYERETTEPRWFMHGVFA